VLVGVQERLAPTASDTPRETKRRDAVRALVEQRQQHSTSRTVGLVAQSTLQARTDLVIKLTGVDAKAYGRDRLLAELAPRRFALLPLVLEAKRIGGLSIDGTTESIDASPTAWSLLLSGWLDGIRQRGCVTAVIWYVVIPSPVSSREATPPCSRCPLPSTSSWTPRTAAGDSPTEAQRGGTTSVPVGVGVVITSRNGRASACRVVPLRMRAHR
jgi:hypothetical protein